MVYAIPSHRRLELFQTKTLAMLLENQVDMKLVYVFVSDETDQLAYEKLAEKYKFKLIYDMPLHNIVEKFNYIHQYFDAGTKVVVIEDDIDQLAIKVGENKLSKFIELPKLAQNMFNECHKAKSGLWGISSNANPFYMSDKVVSGLNFIVANLFGFIATKDRFLRVSQICKSDYERTLLYFVKYGAVVRINSICAITKNYKNAGGLQVIKDQRKALEESACINLVARFPHLIEINQKKSETSMYMELKIKPLRNKKAFTDYMYLQNHYDKEYLRWTLSSRGIPITN